jgi:hypothetical protein
VWIDTAGAKAATVKLRGSFDMRGMRDVARLLRLIERGEMPPDAVP